MAKFTAADWNAIRWYAREHGYKLKDLLVWPMVTYRDKEMKQVNVPLLHIKGCYSKRQKGKKREGA